jgi:hypothetical protein
MERTAMAKYDKIGLHPLTVCSHTGCHNASIDPEADGWTYLDEVEGLKLTPLCPEHGRDTTEHTIKPLQ